MSEREQEIRDHSRAGYRNDELGQAEDDIGFMLAEIAQLRAENKTFDVMLPPLHKRIAELKADLKAARQQIADLRDGLQLNLAYWEKAQHAQTRGAEASRIGSIERDTFRSSASLIASILYTLKPLLGLASAGKEPH